MKRQLVPVLLCEHNPGKLSVAELEDHLIRRLPTTMAGALNELERDQHLMEAMRGLMCRSGEKVFAEQDVDFEIRNHFYKF